MRISQRLSQITEELNKSSHDRQLAEALRERALRVSELVPRGSLERVAGVVLSRLDEDCAASVKLQLNPNFLLKLAESSSDSARKLAARLLPEKFLSKLSGDKCSGVLYELASRCSQKTLKETMFNNLDDEHLHTLFVERFGIPEEEKVERVVKQSDYANEWNVDREADLSDDWYAQAAIKFIQDYGQNIEGRWEEPIVHRYCDSMRLQLGLTVDPEKLLNAIVGREEERDDEKIEFNALKEIAGRLSREILEEEVTLAERVEREDSTLCYLRESRDMSAERTVLAGARLFDVSEGRISKRLAAVVEVSRNLSVPVKGRIPEGRKFDENVEKSLDLFTEQWTKVVNAKGQSVELTWDVECDSDNINFTVSEKR